MKLFFRVFLLSSWLLFHLRAQYMVQGVVTDSLTKEPLPIRQLSERNYGGRDDGQ